MPRRHGAAVAVRAAAGFRDWWGAADSQFSGAALRSRQQGDGAPRPRSSPRTQGGGHRTRIRSHGWRVIPAPAGWAYWPAMLAGLCHRFS